MRLTRVEIEGYRSIGEKVDIHVEQDVTILLGANDHGKTNILSAIEHLNRDTPFALDTDLNWDRMEQGEVFPCVRFHFQLDEAERRVLADGAIEAEEEPQDEASSASIEYTPVDVEAGADAIGTTAEDAPSADATLGPEEMLVERKGINGALRCSAGDVPPSVLETFGEDYLPRVEIIRPQESIPDAVTLDQLQAETHEFMRGILYYAGIDPREAGALFTQDDRTMKQLTEASGTLNETLKVGWNQGKDLRYELSHDSATGKILLRIDDPAVEARLVRASRRSSGFTHFFALKTVLYARQQDHAANSYIFLFDEPGIYLHPSGQQDLLRVLDAIGRQNQAIYSTHSLFMINRTFPSRHRLIVKSDAGTRIDGKPFVSRWGPVIEELGFSLSGTILFAEYVLLAEGDTDAVFLHAVFQKLVEWGKASVDLNAFSVISTESSRNTDVLIRILQEASKPPRLLVMVDGDEGGRKRLKTLKPVLKALKVETHALTKDTTIEDYLPAAGETYIEAVGRYVDNVVAGFGKSVEPGTGIRDRLCELAKADDYTGSNVTTGIASWATRKAKELAELENSPSKLGIAREYVASLATATEKTFLDAQLRRSRDLLRIVQSKLGIPALLEPELKVTND